MSLKYEHVVFTGVGVGGSRVAGARGGNAAPGRRSQLSEAGLAEGRERGQSWGVEECNAKTEASAEFEGCPEECLNKTETSEEFEGCPEEFTEERHANHSHMLCVTYAPIEVAIIHKCRCRICSLAINEFALHMLYMVAVMAQQYQEL